VNSLIDHIQPRNWQLDALSIWNQHQRGIVSVVTGGGKTIFAFLCVLEFLKKFENGRINIIVPTTALLDQWFVSLQDDLHIPETSIAAFSGDEKPEQPNKFNLIIINTARNIAADLSTNKDTFLVVDECHRSGSPINSKALYGHHQATLGISATPKREYDDGFFKYIVPALGPIIFEYDYNDAYKDNIISPFELINIRINFLDDEQLTYDQLSKKIAIELTKSKIDVIYQQKLKILLQKRSLVVSRAIMRIPVAAKIVDLNPGVRTIIFHEQIEAANKLKNILNKRNNNTTIYHSKVAPIIRRNNLHLYKKGLFDVLITCRALDEGLNVPETRIAIIASSTASSRQRIQRLGRVLRPAPGKDFAQIYTIYATDNEEKRLIEEAKNLSEVVSVQWRKVSNA
jgi:superfamily II DNA or RNA helicase